MSLKKRIYILFAISLLILLPVTRVKGTINSIILTPATPTGLSNGLGYYLAGMTYTFSIQVIDPDITGWGNITDVSLTIANPNLAANGAAPYIPVSNQLRLSLNAITGAGAYTPTASAAGQVDASVPYAVVAGTYNNFTITYTLRFLWSATACDFSVKNITAYARTNLPADNYTSNPRSVSYGICSTIRVLNFAQSGVAMDGYVNPWHSLFTITGAIVYNVPGATMGDKVYRVNGGAQLSSAVLFLDGADTSAMATPVPADSAFVNDGTTEDMNFSVPLAFMNSNSITLGSHTWTVRATMTTAGGPVTATGSNLTIICDRVRIDSITFINGGGVTASPTFYRSVNISGTQIVIGASRQFGGANMLGNTTITVRNLENTQDFTLQIPNGSGIGTGSVPFPSVLPAPDGSTGTRTYQVMKITGSVFDNEQDLDIGAGRITQTPPNRIIYWDRNDPPGNNGVPGNGETPFTSQALFSYTVSATSVTFNWQPVTALPNNGDFDTYRIYYRKTNAIPQPWTIVDKTTSGYTISLATPGTTSVIINGLTPFTDYDYFMTAVDVFGQEVEHPIPNVTNSDALYLGAPTAAGYGQFKTNPYAIEASVTDGITNYTYAQFGASINASTRPLRKSSLRATIYIVSSGDQPDSVNLILAQDDGTGSGTGVLNLVTGNVLTAVPHEIIACRKVTTNTWEGFIPSANQYLTEGSYCRFIVESVKNGVSTFSDIDSTIDSDPNNNEYTFMVQTPTNFQPWPTRILNNVLTERNPVCYPSYYLSDDAYVTITAYDIKGRPVATLLDNGFRKGGQNIKEGGWAGDNKARKKLGIGLYYIRFEAKRARDGRTILNETEKVVIAK